VRIVFVGAGEVSIETAKALIGKGHDVVIVETNKEKIDELSEVLDCGFLQGDGSRPDILREVNPAGTDILFCLANNDQINVIASLVGRSLGFKRVVTSIIDPQFEGICRELGLSDTIIPSRTISSYLVDMVQGGGILEFASIIKDEARVFGFIARTEDAVSVKELKLPADARVICYYRDEKFALADEELKIRKGDEIVILTHSKNLPTLQERWAPKPPTEDQHEAAGKKIK